MSTTENIHQALVSVTGKWTKQAKKEERYLNAFYKRCELWEDTDEKWTIKEAAYAVMEKAYNKASSDGQYPAMARQIYYAARGRILELTDKHTLDSDYFTQTLLPSYIEDYPEETATWNVAYDARGHLTEPHTERGVALGTLYVREHLQAISAHSVPEVESTLTHTELYPTCGPQHRYGAILFVEKEGFGPLFEKVKLAERHDIAIMSTKGMSVTACRELVDIICGEQDIPLLVLRDFDKAGFSIVSTLQRDSRRYQFQNTFKVIDLGLRLEDVQQWDLESEDVAVRAGAEDNLRRNGATEEEILFLVGDGQHGRRVELNAFTSEQLIDWLESKLDEHGIHKVVPNPETIEEAYRRAFQVELVNEELRTINVTAAEEARCVQLPKSLVAKTKKQLEQEPERAWDDVIANLAKTAVIKKSTASMEKTKRGTKKTSAKKPS